MFFELFSGCKVNLFLKIKERLASGYHTLASLFYPLSYPTDSIQIKCQKESKFSLKCNKKELEQNNILEKIFIWFKERELLTEGYQIYLQKEVPVGAGLGGGSANAATFLSFLNSRSKRKFSSEELLKVAASFGADVPFFLAKQPAWVEGIGEKIEPLELKLTGLKAILICPQLFISTAWAYKTFDKFQNVQKTFLTTAGWINKSLFSQGRLVLLNDFEPVVFASYPQLRSLKEEMLKLGASGGVLSGSGSAMIFFFRDSKKWEQALTFLEQNKFLYYSYTF